MLYKNTKVHLVSKSRNEALQITACVPKFCFFVANKKPLTIGMQRWLFSKLMVMMMMWWWWWWWWWWSERGKTETSDSNTDCDPSDAASALLVCRLLPIRKFSPKNWQHSYHSFGNYQVGMVRKDTVFRNFSTFTFLCFLLTISLLTLSLLRLSQHLSCICPVRSLTSKLPHSRNVPFMDDNLSFHLSFQRFFLGTRGLTVFSSRWWKNYGWRFCNMVFWLVAFFSIIYGIILPNWLRYFSEGLMPPTSAFGMFTVRYLTNYQRVFHWSTFHLFHVLLQVVVPYFR